MAAHSATDAFSGFPDNVRPPIAIPTPSVWNHVFSNISFDGIDKIQEKYAAEIEKMKEEARSMLVKAKGSANINKLTLVDLLERLGVAYHFEPEIEELVEQIYNFHSKDEDGDYDLLATALQFRVLRQHRYRVSSSVFEKFKDKCNKFKKTLSTDCEGLLSFYEAAETRMHEEDILDEAVEFTVNCLNQMLPELKSPLHDKVKRALEQSFHRGISRLETRSYISIYEMSDTKDENLLKFAKIDYNYLQNIYRKELHDLVRWWNDFDLASELPYVRDRVAEGYLWGVACRFEPQYSYVRTEYTKLLKLSSVIDDTYDNYATLDEAELFTEIVERWDINEMERLPDYMKVVYRFTLNVYEEFKREATKQEKSFAIPYAEEGVKQVCKAYLRELKWLMGRQLPTFDEYIANTVITSWIPIYFAYVSPGVTSVTKDAIHCLVSEPPNKMVAAAAKTLRFMQDLCSYEREKKNGKMLTGIDFYMKEHGVSKKEAMEKYADLAEVAWKDANAAWVAKTSMSKDFYEGILNYARAADVTYKNSVDRYTNPEKFAVPQIAALFVDPIPI